MTEQHADGHACSADIVILGGGIAGLWLLNHLSSRGYSVILLESAALGAGQSIASQGIIHGGLKYALSGTISEAARAIAGMPDRWLSCLAGKDPVNLADCNLLSDRYYMWSEGSFRSRIKTFLGSKSLRGRIDRVSDNDFPPAMEEAKGQGSLYKLPDFVVDVPSLLTTLAGPHRDRIFRIDTDTLDFLEANRSGQENDQPGLSLTLPAGTLSISAKRLVLAAGEGNRQLLQMAGLSQPAMQTRPLNMVMLRAPKLPRLYLHCIGDDFSLTPRLTLTSHPCADGDIAWYLGGELAESGLDRTDDQQIEVARQLLTSLFPWVDTSAADWACLRINRAEGIETGRHRPDSLFLKSTQDILVAWPTKFTLSPALADAVTGYLESQGIMPGPSSGLEVLQDWLAPASVAEPPWETQLG